MKTLVYVAILSVVTTAFVNAGDIYYDIRDAPYLFHKFIRDYNRMYKDSEEVLIRFASFIQSLDVINNANAKSKTATFDINKFADYTKEEKKRMLGYIPGSPRQPARYS